MAIIDTNWNPSKKELRIFSALQILFFALVAFVIVRKHTETLDVPVMIVSVSAVVGILGMIFTPLIRVVYVVWMAILFPVGWVVSHVLMGIVFYLVFTPIAVLMRIVGYDPMKRKFEPDAKTYWVRRQPRSETAHYFKQF